MNILILKLRQRSTEEWISSLPVFLLLFIVILAGNGEKIHGRLLQAGELLWQDYFMLRADIPTPDCNPDPDLAQELSRLERESASDDGLDELFEEASFEREAALSSLISNKNMCIEKHRVATDNQQRVTAEVKAFRALEQGVALLSAFIIKQDALLLMLLIFICAAVCTFKHHHIAFKPVRSRMDHYVSVMSQLFGNSLLFLSAISYRQSLFDSATHVEHPGTYLLLIAGFAVLVLINLYQLLYPAKYVDASNGLLPAMRTIPLYIFMALITGWYFFVVEDHRAGLTIFFSLLFDQAGLFLNIGLYIWVGMLLKHTKLGFLVFRTFIPWRMSPELLAVVAITVMAIPTAYTGASGIIIIAMGGIVYKELRRAGARRQLALAATAMTGGAGVVLRPCLLVVLIAALNKEVVTDQLFSWGLKVFFTTIGVFFVFSWVSRKGKMSIAPLREAIPPCLRAIRPLLPYAIILIVTILAYRVILNIQMDEFSAPVILPVIILVVILYEKMNADKHSLLKISEHPMNAFECTIRGASSDASIHIGALLLLMGLSFATGGVVERSGVLDSIPETFSSIWLALGFLMIILLGIGMVMDPFGAVVLVTGTIAQIAYKNGIDPVHFWMITLVSFELGYLTPPVALNHLLTRQVVGCNEVDKSAYEGENFWYRNERILLPVVAMGTTWILVAIIPLL